MDIKKLLYGSEQERNNELTSVRRPFLFEDVCYAGDDRGKLLLNDIYIEPAVAFKVKGYIGDVKEHGEVFYKNKKVKEFTNIKNLTDFTKKMHDAVKENFHSYVEELKKQIQSVFDADKLNKKLDSPIIHSVVGVVVIPDVVLSVKENDAVEFFHPEFNVEISFLSRDGKNGLLKMKWYNVSDTPIRNFVVSGPIIMQNNMEVMR